MKFRETARTQHHIYTYPSLFPLFRIILLDYTTILIYLNN